MPTNKEIIEAAYASFAVGDVPAVLAVMDPKIEWTEAEGWPLYDGTFVGPQAIVEAAYASFAVGDVPAVLAVMDPKIEWTEAEGWPLYDGTFVGPQAIADG